jgi:hypothetical protein
MVHAKTYNDILQLAEKKLTDFLEMSPEELKSKINYDITIYEANNDGVTLPTFTAEVQARVRNSND